MEVVFDCVCLDSSFNTPYLSRSYCASRYSCRRRTRASGKLEGASCDVCASLLGAPFGGVCHCVRGRGLQTTMTQEAARLLA
jgi:hypothetical protein